jgi:hypothetical protein
MSEKLNMTNSITTKYYWGLWWSWSYGSWIYNYLCSQYCEFESSSGECAYMLNVYKSQLSRQTGSRNLTGQKTLPTKWVTYMKLVTKYQISAINICWEKCDKKYLGWTEGRKDGQMDRDKTVYPPPPPGSGGIIIQMYYVCSDILNHLMLIKAG